MGTIYDLYNGGPELPAAVQEYMRVRGFTLRLYGGEWYVTGEEGGEPFELTVDLFLALYHRGK